MDGSISSFFYSKIVIVFSFLLLLKSVRFDSDFYFQAANYTLYFYILNSFFHYRAIFIHCKLPIALSFAR